VCVCGGGGLHLTIIEDRLGCRVYSKLLISITNEIIHTII